MGFSFLLLSSLSVLSFVLAAPSDQQKSSSGQGFLANQALAEILERGAPILGTQRPISRMNLTHRM